MSCNIGAFSKKPAVQDSMACDSVLSERKLLEIYLVLFIVGQTYATPGMPSLRVLQLLVLEHER